MSTVIKIGDLELNANSRMLFVCDKPVQLRNKEFSLMEFMMQNAGKVLSRTDIIEGVWDRNICWATNTVDVHVSSLRRKLRKNGGRHFIQTVHCIGYRFGIT